MCVHQKTHAGLLLAALFVIPPNRKLPKCPLTVEWISKLWSIHTMESYLAMRKNNLEPHAPILC